MEKAKLERGAKKAPVASRSAQDRERSSKTKMTKVKVKNLSGSFAQTTKATPKKRKRNADIDVVSKWRRPKSEQPIHATRLANLRVIKTWVYQNNAARMARDISRSETFLWQLFNGYRAMGEKVARHIEEKLKLEHLALDKSDVSKPAKSVTAQLGEGKAVEYQMAPRVSLDALNKKLRGHFARACTTGCSENTFHFEVTTEAVQEFFLGSAVFFDCDDHELVNLHYYVIQPKSFARHTGTIMLAKKLDGNMWSFTNSHLQLTSPDVERIVGRVVQVTRDFVKA